MTGWAACEREMENGARWRGMPDAGLWHRMADARPLAQNNERATLGAEWQIASRWRGVANGRPQTRCGYAGALRL